ncbi:MAG: stearoyl-CoA desaturase (delta-9 desaturase) [Gammaproteobacteria bacterium]|nr:MAG: stearoyl-CoA desaturase (delta-9 desaturase) [Gammaproteobacteria bacterium]TND02677.1 MAG: stearoyl-CoA desaturase (delta-9 desaturase) [Gammaproteobacteria bacterium]
MIDASLNFLSQGLLDLPVWGYVVAALILTHITIASVTIYLHRHQAHRALELHPLVSHFCRFWLWLTTGMRTGEWVAIHRKHHAKCETEEDPHSPQVRGINEVLWRGAELYNRACNIPGIVQEYGHGTPDDWLERHVYARSINSGISLMLIVDLLLFGVGGLTVWAVQMLWIPFFAAGVINGIGHYWGYRNYEVPDAATNIVPWGILVGGEELHNNHHTYAGSAKLSSKSWEFDIGWMYVRMLAALGLATVKKLPPEMVVDPHKGAVDMDTLKAVVSNRFQIMSHYCRDVLKHVHRDELRVADKSYRNMLKRARRLLVREESLMDEHARLRLNSVLSRSQTLKTVYRFKQTLQDIGKRSAATQDQLLHALQEWCREAEETGIQALEDFARALRGYSLRPVMI